MGKKLKHIARTLIVAEPGRAGPVNLMYDELNVVRGFLEISPGLPRPADVYFSERI
jgi:hypothetical protein